MNVVVNEVDFNPEFISRMIPKVDWGALVQAAQQVRILKRYLLVTPKSLRFELKKRSIQLT